MYFLQENTENTEQILNHIPFDWCKTIPDIGVVTLDYFN